MTLTRLALAAALAATTFAAPAPARASDCVNDTINDCRQEFSGKDYYSVAMRGWCYLIGIGICKAVS